MYRYGLTVTIRRSTLFNNTADCRRCAGGALALAGGGDVTLDGVKVVDNHSGQLGGGAVLGPGADAFPTCALHLIGGTVFSGNTADNGGAQVASCVRGGGRGGGRGGCGGGAFVGVGV